MSDQLNHKTRYFLITMLVLSVVLLLLLQDELCELGLVDLSRIALLLMAGTVVVAALRNRSIFSITMIYLILYCLFHFGMILAFGLKLPMGGELEFVFKNYWPKGKYLNESVYLAALGAIALILGYYVPEIKRNVTKKYVFVRGNIDDERFRADLRKCGFFILSSAILFWFYKIMTAGGIAALFGAYGVIMEISREGALSFVYYLIGFGFVLLAVAGRDKLDRSGVVIFCIFAVVGFPLGLRGEILFPMATAVAIASATGFRISKAKTLVLALLLLCAIGGVRVLRQSGLTGYSFSIQDFLPQHALMEMGGQIWSVAEMSSWADRGEPYLYGASFWAPFERALYYVVPGIERPPADQDERLLELVLEKRVSAIGFSPVAEGYRNFGSYGVVLVMFVIGIVLSFLENHLDSLLMRALAGVILFPLVIYIRNSFTPIPFQVIFGCTIVFILAFRNLQMPGLVDR